MADDIDMATEIIDREISLAVSKIRQNSSKNNTGSKICIECGDKIPEPRQKLGFKLCVPCAEEEERKKSLYVD